MKIIAIGDPHGNLSKIKKIPVKEVDLILLTGDLGNSDLARKQAFANITRRKKNLPEIDFSAREKKRAFMQAYNSSIDIIRYLSKKAPVYLIYGNVESSNAETKYYSKEIGLPLPYITNKLKKMKNVKIINNKLVNFNSLKIAGLSYFIDDIWVKTFKPSNYKKRLNSAKKDTFRAKELLYKFKHADILICHQPPYGILDRVTANFAPAHWKGKNAGSKVILDYILKNRPKYVFCGHIHEGRGHRKVGKTEVYNLGVCGYKTINI